MILIRWTRIAQNHIQRGDFKIWYHMKISFLKLDIIIFIMKRSSNASRWPAGLSHPDCNCCVGSVVCVSAATVGGGALGQSVGKALLREVARDATHLHLWRERGKWDTQTAQYHLTWVTAQVFSYGCTPIERVRSEKANYNSECLILLIYKIASGALENLSSEDFHEWCQVISY